MMDLRALTADDSHKGVERSRLDTGPIQGIHTALNAGDLVMLVDDRPESDSGRGGFFCVARLTSAKVVNAMALHARGLACVVLNRSAAARLGLEHMEAEVTLRANIPYYLASIEAAACPGTGISARDRAMTMRAAGRPDARPGDVISPGHVIPILVPSDGRADNLPFYAHLLVRHMSRNDVAGWCDILDDAGDVADKNYCLGIAKQLNIPVALLSGAKRTCAAIASESPADTD